MPRNRPCILRPVEANLPSATRAYLRGMSRGSRMTLATMP